MPLEEPTTFLDIFGQLNQLFIFTLALNSISIFAFRTEDVLGARAFIVFFGYAKSPKISRSSPILRRFENKFTFSFTQAKEGLVSSEVLLAHKCILTHFYVNLIKLIGEMHIKSDLSDSDYLESSDLPHMMTILFSQLSSIRAEDHMAYTKAFFERIQSYRHVLGQNFEFVSSCKLNRRAMVFCCRESLHDFQESTLLPQGDYLLLLRVLCPDFPSAICERVAEVLGPSRMQEEERYPLGEFSAYLSFMLLYQPWLHEFSTVFEDSYKLISLDVARSKIYSSMAEWWGKFDMPSELVIESVLGDLLQTHGDDGRITHDVFIRAFAKNPLSRSEVEFMSTPKLLH
jgi:hypothetical protein